MKIDTSTLEALRERIAPLDTPEIRAAYRAGKFPRSDLVKDLDRRYRFDLFYVSRAADILPVDAEFSDSHIYTALCRIVKPLNLDA